jgi:hypothetical protein
MAFFKKNQRSPLSSVRNIVAAWKERNVATGGRRRLSGLPDRSDFDVDGSGGESSSGGLTTPMSTSTSGLPPPIVAELAEYAGEREVGFNFGTCVRCRFDDLCLSLSMNLNIIYLWLNRQPLRIGWLWYLNVHTPPPYRWQCCQAVLYPHIILLSWIAPGGGRGVVKLDLLRCTEVMSVPSLTHPNARGDVGTVAARTQSEGSDSQSLMELLCPFQMYYEDGIERLAVESARERVRWVSAIW